jgi:hypothetical protein
LSPPPQFKKSPDALAPRAKLAYADLGRSLDY